MNTCIKLFEASFPDDLKAVARNVVWFEKPEQTLQNKRLFLAHLMTYGTLPDIRIAKKYYQEADFAEVLANPPAGVFDKRSWSFWNWIVLKKIVHELPSRKFA